jgi:hypothetical protein
MSLRHAPTPPSMNQQLRSGEDTRIAGRWLLIARLSFVVVSIFDLVLSVIGTPVYFAYLHTLCAGCFDERLSPDKLQALQALGISITTYAVYWVAINLLFALVYFAVAALIFWRKSDDWMALLASFSLVAFGASFPGIPAVLAAVHPGWWLPVTLLGENVLGFPSLLVFFFLFPTGRFVPRWTRWVALGFTVLQVVTAFYPVSLLTFSTWPGLLFPLAALVVFGSLVFSQVYRYRRISTPVERQQTKWIVLGAAVGLLGFLLLGVLLPAWLQLVIPLQSLDALLVVLLITGIYLVLLLIPLSFAIAILRYRLWDIDIIINRTLVYGTLTVILTVVYVGLIIGLSALLRGIISQDNSVAIVLSTLAIAAVFQPLRHRIQAVIDRRFYRSKYDAARTLTAFSATLRNEVDLDQLKEHLLAVVEETMQPAHASLWLRKSGHERKPGTQV